MNKLQRYKVAEIKQPYNRCKDYHLCSDVDAYLAKHLPKDCEWEYRDVPAQGSGCGWHEVYHPEWKFCPYCGGKIVEAPTEGE